MAFQFWTGSLPVLVGSGALAGSDATTSGAGVIKYVGSGTLAGTDAAISGSAKLLLIGEGAITAQAATTTGACKLLIKSTSAGLVAEDAQTTGEGSVAITITGNMTGAAATMPGSNGKLIIQGSGTLVGTNASTSGSNAKLLLIGTGALVAEDAELVGTSYPVYYVDGAQPATGDGTFATPFKTIAEGLTAVRDAGLAGRVSDLFIKGGHTYTNEPIELLVGSAGQVSRYLRVKSYSGQVVLDGNNVGTYGISNSVAKTNYVEVNGDFKLINWTSDPVFVGSYGQTPAISSWDITGLTIHDNGDPTTTNTDVALRAEQTSNLYITSCDIRRNSGYGISVGATGKFLANNIVLQNNAIDSNAISGLRLYSLSNFTLTDSEFTGGMWFRDQAYSWGVNPSQFALHAFGGDYDELYIFNNLFQDYEKLVYFDLRAASANLSNCLMFGNRFELLTYITTYAGSGQAIQIDARDDTATLSGWLEVYCNSFKRFDTAPVSLLKNAATSWSPTLKHYNNVYDDPNNGTTLSVISRSTGVNIAGGYNCYWTCTGPAGETGNLYVDPLLDINFKLNSLSPCRGAGHPTLGSVITIPPSVDWENNPRTINNGDIGADEYTSADHNGQGTLTGSSATIVCNGKLLLQGSGSLAGANAVTTNTGKLLLQGAGILLGEDATFTGAGTLSDISFTHIGSGVLVGEQAAITNTAKLLIKSTLSGLAGSDASLIGIGKLLITGEGALIGEDGIVVGTSKAILTLVGNLIGANASIQSTAKLLLSAGGGLTGRDAILSGEGKLLIIGEGTLEGTDATFLLTQVGNDVIVKRIVTRVPVKGQLISP